MGRLFALVNEELAKIGPYAVENVRIPIFMRLLSPILQNPSRFDVVAGVPPRRFVTFRGNVRDSVVKWIHDLLFYC